MNQYEQIEAYIAEFGSIMPIQAFSDLRITKLPPVYQKCEKKAFSAIFRWL